MQRYFQVCTTVWQVLMSILKKYLLLQVKKGNNYKLLQLYSIRQHGNNLKGNHWISNLVDGGDL